MQIFTAEIGRQAAIAAAHQEGFDEGREAARKDYERIIEGLRNERNIQQKEISALFEEKLKTTEQIDRLIATNEQLTNSLAEKEKEIDTLKRSNRAMKGARKAK